MLRENGPFDEGLARDLFRTMREGAAVRAFRTEGGTGAPSQLGWFQNERGDLFAAETDELGLRTPGAWIRLEEILPEFIRLSPDFVVHHPPPLPGRDTPPHLIPPAAPQGEVTELTPAMQERVKRLIEDSRSGNHPSLQNRKVEHRMGSFTSWGLACYVVRSVLQYGEPRQSICEELAPVVDEAMEVFKKARPDLGRW